MGDPSNRLHERNQPVMKRTLFFVLPALLASQLHAQTFPGPIGNNAYGKELAILNDVDGLGRRDLVVSSPAAPGATGSSGTVYIVAGESTSTPATVLATLTAFQAGLPANGVQFGRALANVGPVGANPNDVFAVATPNIPATAQVPSHGEVRLWRVQQSGSGVQLVPSFSLGGATDPSFGTSLAVLTGQSTANGRALAVGIPNQNRVEIYDPSTGALLRTLNVQTPSGGLGGKLGFSLAFGAGNVLAAGAPEYTSPGAPITQYQGYVALYNLNNASNFPTAFLYRAQASESLGFAIASVGQLPGGVNSPMSDFAVLARGVNGVAPAVHLFHSPNLQLPSATPTLASYTLPVGAPQAATDGRMVSLGDIDGNGVGDFAVTARGFLNVFSTANNALASVASAGASTDAGLASGPDLRGVGASDLVLGTPNLTPTTGTAWVLPLATSVRLPNPPGVSLDLSSRPFGGAACTLTVTGTPGNLVGVLAYIAPFTPVPFNGGPSLAYLPASGSTSIGVGTSPATFQVTMPSGFTSQAILFQAVQSNANGTLSVSNGILARLGTM